jgi:acetyl esterase/lipase
MRWLFLVLLVAAPAKAQPAITTSWDVVYARAGDRELKLDLARPTTRGPHPAVVVLHGGGWRMGNKKDVRPWVEMLARRGYVAAGVAYRLAPDHVFPAQIEDCKTAVRFLRTNADTYAIDKDRVAAMGYSAGGHLACLLGLTDESVGFDGKLYPAQSSKVSCVIDYFGPTDLAGFGKDEAAQRSMLGPLIGAKFTEKPEAHERASPLTYVKRGTPPFLIFHGTKDWIVPIEQSRALANKLKDVGGSVKLIEVPDEGHGWAGRANVGTTEATLEFLAEQLKK